MQFRTKQLPRSGSDYVKGASSPIPYLVRNETGDWLPYVATFKNQREDGYDTFDCWDFASLNNVIATQCNFLKQTGQFPEASLAWFQTNGYIDEHGSFAFSERFYACLATYSNGSPVRDGGNDQIELPRLVNQWGLLPRIDFDADPKMVFANQNIFNNYFYDKSQITQAMYAKAKQSLQYLSIAYEWVGKEGTMPSLTEMKAAQLQSPLALGLPVPKIVPLWNFPTVQYDGGKEAAHSVGLMSIGTDGIFHIRDQYNPMDKILSADYFIPMVSLIYVTPVLQPEQSVPQTAVPYPDSIWTKIWKAVWMWFNPDIIKTMGLPRSEKWGSVRKAWIKDHSTCAACGTNKNIQVHHVVAFHTHPEKELDPSNFISLCEGMERNCHRFIGHLDNFQSINENSREDAALWLERVKHRPSWDKVNEKWVSA